MSEQTALPLAGKVAIVSGASKRLGRCYVMALGRAGATVVALARSLGDDPTQMGTLAEVEASGRAEGFDVHAYRCDIGDEDELRRVIGEVAERFGGIDCVVNNAVYAAEKRETMDIAQDVWEEAMRVNVRAPYVLTTLARPYMIARGGGSIVNISSLAAQNPGKGSGAHAGLVMYGVSKAALNRLTTWFGHELADDNIAVNAISPGDVSVYMRLANGIGAEVPDRDVVAGEQLDEAFWGNPVAWLAGARPADVTGQVLHTYTFGESWGPAYDTPPEWSPIVAKILRRNNLKAPV